MMRRRLPFALLVGFCAVAPACTTIEPAPVRASTGTDTPESASIFALDVALIDQNGTRIRLADLAGRPTILAMGYTSCVSICPRVIEEMKAVEHALGARAAGVGFVLVSLDPSRDSPQALRRFASERHLDLTRWRLLAPSEDGLRDLAAVLGVRYAPAPSGEIVHSGLIVALDRSGVVRHRQIGVAQDLKPLLDAVGAAPN